MDTLAEIESLKLENQNLKERLAKLEKYVDYLLINTNGNRAYNVDAYNRQLKNYTVESYEQFKDDIINKTDKL